MTTRKTVLLALLCPIFVLCPHAGCGSSQPSQSSQSSQPSQSDAWIACAKDEFRLVGQLDGQAVDIRESTVNSGGGMTQLTTGELSTQMVSLAEDPSRTKLDLQWPKTIVDGATTDATGTLLMPSSGVLASQSYCLGSGTQVHTSSDGETLQFKIAGVKGGNGCGTAVTGELQGCWR
jgi:hypothetical protein